MDYKSNVLKNVHVLNFFDISSNIDIPKWFIPDKPRLWAGDVDTESNDFKNASKDLYYNVFYCYPETTPDGYKNLNNNLTYLHRKFGEGNYLICLIDIEDKIQVKKFSIVFVDYFDEYKIKGNNYGGDKYLISKILKLNCKFYDERKSSESMGLPQLYRLLDINYRSDYYRHYNHDIKLTIDNKLISNDSKETLTNNIEIYDNLISIILKKLDLLLNNHILSKFFINDPVEELKFNKDQLNPSYLQLSKNLEYKNKLMIFNKEQFQILYQFIILNYKNKFSIFKELFKIYLFLVQNFDDKLLPSNLFGLINIVDGNIVYYFQKKFDTSLQASKQKYLKYKKKYLLLKHQY
jgi:hypothetical protein